MNRAVARMLYFVSIALMAALLTACGGSSSDGPEPADQTPVSESAADSEADSNPEPAEDARETDAGSEDESGNGATSDTAQPESETGSPSGSNSDSGDAAEESEESADVPGILAVNEIVAKAAGDGYDWIELYVTRGTVNLAGYTLTDDKTDREPAYFSDAVLTAGQFFLVAAADEPPADGIAYVPFKLGSDDAVFLYQNGELADALDWEDGEAPEGYSFGKSTDGGVSSQTLDPTPGASNKLPETPPSIADEAISDLFPQDRVVDVYITIDSADMQSILNNPLDEEEKPAAITYDGRTLDRVSFRTKGNSSLRNTAQSGSNRFSFKVDMNEYDDDQTLLGLKKLNLNNCFKDPSFMRERISYDMMRYLGLPTPQTAYVNLYINNELYGLYLAVEDVDSAFLKQHFEDDDGDLYKPDGAGSDLKWYGNNIQDYPGMTLESNEDTSGHGALFEMLTVLNFGNDYESVIDTDNVLRYLAVSTVLTNLDSYQGPFAHNYYLYEENGRFSIIPWDMNESFGGFTMGCDREGLIHFMIDEPTSTALADRPLIDNLLQRAAYLNAYHGYIRELINGPFSPDVLAQTIETTANLIRPHVRADPTKFFTFAQFEQSLTEDTANIIGLMAFCEERVEAVRNQLNGISPASGDGSGNCGEMTGPGAGGPMQPPMGRPPGNQG